MKTEVKKLAKGQVELTVELSLEEYQPFLEQAAKIISQNTKIPGFRPGKANFNLIKAKVGEAEIWQQALERAVQKTLVKALAEQRLMTVGSPKIEVIKLAPGNPVIYKATINLLPNVSLADFSKIKISQNKIEVRQEEIKKSMTDLQKMRSQETLADKKAEAGDKVEIDFETFLDKIPLDQGKNEKFPLVIGEKTFIPGFEEQLIGMAKDETKTFQLKFPENYHQKNLAGRLVDFKVKVNAVYHLDLPKLDDSFAKSLGQFNNLKELEDKIRENLRLEAQDKENRRLEEELLDKSIDQSKFEEIPDILIDSETKKMLEELEHNLAHQGLKFEDYLHHLKKTQADLLLNFVPQAIKRIKSALVIRAVGQNQNIKATEAEIESEVQKILATYAGNSEAEKNISQPAYRDYLKNILTARKVIEYLKSVMVE